MGMTLVVILRVAQRRTGCDTIRKERRDEHTIVHIMMMRRRMEHEG